MLDLLRDAFANNWTVVINYNIDPGRNNGMANRLWVVKLLGGGSARRPTPTLHRSTISRLWGSFTPKFRRPTRENRC